jgi:hypothetical protein
VWVFCCQDQRMSGAILPFPNTLSWRGVQLKKNTGITLPFSGSRFEVFSAVRIYLCVDVV